MPGARTNAFGARTNAIGARTKLAFGALILAQAAHSLEEYAGALWRSFPPAAYVSGLVSADRELGFLIVNCALVAFGAWCAAWPVRREWPVARALMWGWIAVELVNGVGHPLWSVRQGGYTPGVVTAVVLLVVALVLWRQLQREPAPD